MRLVCREEFLKMPEGIIAMKYNGGSFDGIFVKGKSLNNDFILTYLTNQIDTTGSDDLFDKLKLLEDGKSLSISYEETMRDGEYQEDQNFAVWSAQDIDGL